VSTPPVISAYSVNSPPTTKMYQLNKFSFGKARSLAPIMIGTRKLPSTEGMAGMRKKNTIITPCIVNSLL